MAKPHPQTSAPQQLGSPLSTWQQGQHREALATALEDVSSEPCYLVDLQGLKMSSTFGLTHTGRSSGQVHPPVLVCWIQWAAEFPSTEAAAESCRAWGGLC